MSRFTAQEVFDEIDRQAPSVGVPAKLARAFFIAENSGSGTMDPARVISGAAVSPKGARGVMQTIPSTEAALQKQGLLPADWKFSPGDLPGQVRAGLAALQEMRGRQKNPSDVLELGAMYNAGTEGWKNYRAGALDRLPAETRGYFTKLQTALGLGPNMPSPTTPSTPATPATDAGANSSTSVRSSTRSTVFDPAAFDAAMQNATTLYQNGGSFDTAINSLLLSQQNRQVREQQHQAAIVANAKQQGVAIAAENAVAAGEAARRNEILTAAGINPADATNRANSAMERIMLEMPGIETAGAEIDARQAVGIFDNPLQWLVNQVRLPGMVGDYNAKVRSVNREIEGVKNLQGLAATQITLGQASDADLITAAAREKAAATAAAAQERLAEVQAATAGAGVRDAQTALAMQTERVRGLIDIAQLTKQVRSENVGMSEADAKRKAQEIQLERVNNWLKMIGSNQRYDTVTFNAIPAKSREELLVASSGDGISRNLWDGLSAINSLGNWQKMAAEGDAAAVTWMRNTVSKADQAVSEELKLAEQQAKITGKPIAKREEFLAAQVAKIEQLYTAEQADMRTASQDNPYRLSYETLIKKPELAENAVTKFLAANGPTSASPIFNKVDEKYIMDHFTGQALAGKISTGEAAKQISSFYRTAVPEQAARSKYALFGFAPAAGYQVNIPPPGLFSGLKTVKGSMDLSNAAQVEEYLVRSVAVQSSQKFQGFFGSFGAAAEGQRMNGSK